MKATSLSPLSEREKLELRIGGLEERIKRLTADIHEDEMTLAAMRDGTTGAGESVPVPGPAGRFTFVTVAPAVPAGFADEDECACFIASAQGKLTAMLAELDGLYAEWALLVQAETAAAA